jgi:hypothetical protein
MPRDGALVDPSKGNLFIPWLAKRDAARRRAQHHVARRLANKIAPHLDGLAGRLFCRLDELRVSATIRCDCETRNSIIVPWLTDAIAYPWLMLDSQHARTVILLDVDHPDARERAEYLNRHCGLPMPTIAADPYTGRAHAFWLLATPVMITQGRAKPLGLFEIAGRMLARAMGAALLPHGALAKNPWGQATRLGGSLMHRDGPPATPAVWEAHRASGSPLVWVTTVGDLVGVELTRIITALEGDEGEWPDRTQDRQRTRKAKQAPPSKLAADSRNCLVFDLARYPIYRAEERVPSVIHDVVAGHNRTLPQPMDPDEVAGIARSITRYMQRKFRDREGRIGDPEWQAERGRKSRASVAAKNGRILQEAKESLVRSGTKPTQRAVALKTGLPLITVKRHWSTT